MKKEINVHNEIKTAIVLLEGFNTFMENDMITIGRPYANALISVNIRTISNLNDIVDSTPENTIEIDTDPDEDEPSEADDEHQD